MEYSIQQIRDMHMKYRCYWMAFICMISAHDWFMYTLYSSIDLSWGSSYCMNCILTSCYISWDTWSMIGGNERTVLYRKDLMIHHIMTIPVFIGALLWCPLCGSLVSITESLSLMNYIFRDKSYERLLHYYRIVIVFFIRLPVFLFFINYATYHVYRYIDQSVCGYLCYNIGFQIPKYGTILFIMYDVNIIYKIWKSLSRSINPKIQ